MNWMGQSGTTRIQRQYAEHATAATAGDEVRRLAIELGYEDGTLDRLPDDANLGLSCGNPVAVAELAPGDSVLDLGCGAGFDAFVAARTVGPAGRVVGLDVTPEMINRARANATACRRAGGADNVAFETGAVEALPFEDAAFDVVISNCALNLVEDQRAAHREILRVLRPGGRMAIADLALSRPIPAAALRPLRRWIGCVAGLADVSTLQRRLAEAGFTRIRIEPQPGRVGAMTACRPGWRGALLRLPVVRRLADLVVSVAIRAERPVDE